MVAAKNSHAAARITRCISRSCGKFRVLKVANIRIAAEFPTGICGASEAMVRLNLATVY